MIPARGQRVAVLVDTADLYHGARHRFSGRVDYRLLLERIVGDRALVRAIAFVLRGEGVDVTPFLDALRGAGFEARVRVLPRRADGTLRGNQNVGLALAAAALADRVDAIAIASGVSDFAEVCDHLAVRGVRTEVFAIAGAAAPALLDAAHAVTLMDQTWLMGRASIDGRP